MSNTPLPPKKTTGVQGSFVWWRRRRQNDYSIGQRYVIRTGHIVLPRKMFISNKKRPFVEGINYIAVNFYKHK